MKTKKESKQKKSKLATDPVIQQVLGLIPQLMEYLQYVALSNSVNGHIGSMLRNQNINPGEMSESLRKAIVLEAFEIDNLVKETIAENLKKHQCSGG